MYQRHRGSCSYSPITFLKRVYDDDLSPPLVEKKNVGLTALGCYFARLELGFHNLLETAVRLALFGAMKKKVQSVTVINS